jgi:NADPH-dependent ferric siderophore reductase
MVNTKFVQSGEEVEAADQRHQITRVSFEPRRHTARVASCTRITPNMLRLVLTAPDFADFDSRSPGDHIKFFWPTDGTSEEVAREYTPRAFDRGACTLTVDFALHDAGPATAWARNARAGDGVDVRGPRSSRIVPDDFDWYLLVGDETGLPSIGRRLEELRTGVPVFTVVAVDGEQEVQQIDTGAKWLPRWVFRDQEGNDDAETLRRAVQSLDLPSGDGYIWIAGELSVARSLRTYLLDERGHPSRWMQAAGYWRRGAPGAHEDLD